jgi:hypothetical protein
MKSKTIHILILILFILAVIYITRPLYKHLDTHVPGNLGDSVMGVYLLGWHYQTMFSGWEERWNCGFFYPHKKVLAYLEHMFFLGVMAYPLIAITGSYIAGHNILLMLGFALSAFAMYWVMYQWTESYLAGLVSGIIYGFNPFMQNYVSHVHLIHIWTFPLILYFLQRYFTFVYYTDILIYCGIYFIIGFLTNNHLAVYLSLIIPVYSLYLIIYEKPYKSLVRKYEEISNRKIKSEYFYKRFFIEIIIAVIVIGIVLLPFIYPYLQLQQERCGAFGWGTLRHFQPQILKSLFTPNEGNWLAYQLRDTWLKNLYDALPKGKCLYKLYPGIIAVMLAIYGRRKGWILLFLAGIILSMGPFLTISGKEIILQPYYLMCQYIPGLVRLRITTRGFIIVMLSLSIMAGYGITRLLDKKPKLFAYPLVVILIVLICFEYNTRGIRMSCLMPDGKVPEVYQKLANEPGEFAILELPIKRNAASYIFYSLYHGKKMINGYASYIPPDYNKLRRQFNTCDVKGIKSILKGIGNVKYLVINQKELINLEDD